MSDFTADVSAPTVSAADVDVWAEWLCDIGYPFDISFPENPPPVNHAVLARLWNERDDWRISDDDAEACVRYEAGLTIADEWEALSERIAAAVDAVTRLGVAVDAVLAALGFTVADEGGQER